MPLTWEQVSETEHHALGTYRREPVSARITSSRFGLHVLVYGRRGVGGNRRGETVAAAKRRAQSYCRWVVGRGK